MADELERRNLLQQVGGRAFLLALAAAPQVGYDARLYGAHVASQAAERRRAQDADNAGQEPAEEE
jgi:replicative DNA helicase